jgi:hypothetical protein
VHGEVKDSGVVTGTATTSTPRCIGDEAGHGVARHYKGAIDDLAIFKRALTQDEVEKLYNGNWELPDTSKFLNLF